MPLIEQMLTTVEHMALYAMVAISATPLRAMKASVRCVPRQKSRAMMMFHALWAIHVMPVLVLLVLNSWYAHRTKILALKPFVLQV